MILGSFHCELDTLRYEDISVPVKSAAADLLVLAGTRVFGAIAAASPTANSERKIPAFHA
jgi:hypothetical protein